MKNDLPTAFMALDALDMFSFAALALHVARDGDLATHRYSVERMVRRAFYAKKDRDEVLAWLHARESVEV